MAKVACTIAPAKLALYEALVATNPDVQRKGAKNPYTSRNGHMFSFLTQEGQLALRLSEEERGAFMKEHRTRAPVVYDTVMKEYVLVPHALLKKTRELKPWFDRSYAYVGSLKPKPTTRKKAAKKKAAKKRTTKKKAAASRKKTASKKKGVARKRPR